MFYLISILCAPFIRLCSLLLPHCCFITFLFYTLVFYRNHFMLQRGNLKKVFYSKCAIQTSLLLPQIDARQATEHHFSAMICVIVATSNQMHSFRVRVALGADDPRALSVACWISRMFLQPISTEEAGSRMHSCG